MVDIMTDLVICVNDLSDTPKKNNHKLLKEYLIDNFWQDSLGYKILSLGISKHDVEILFSINDIEPVGYGGYDRFRIVGYIRFLDKTHNILLKLITKDYYLENKQWIYIAKILTDNEKT